MKFVKKDMKPALSPRQAFLAQRQNEPGSVRLRNEVAQLLTQGKAHTETVAKVFELIVTDSADRITSKDVARVLPGYEVAPTDPASYW